MKHVADIERRAAIMSEVTVELERQDEKWGVQNHNRHYWNTIITEELGESAEAAFEVDTLENYAAAKHYATELVHVAACAVQAVETLRRLHPEWEPENKLTSTPKGVPPRGEIKGQIDLSDLFGLDTPDARHQFREKALTDPMFSAAVKIILQLLPDHEYEREMTRQQRIAGR